MPSEAELIARWDAHAPRYTSYPTAAAFGPAVEAADWNAALAGLKPGKGVSLYVHLPFCKRLCWYCGCNTRAVNRRETIDSYVELLLQEADLVAAAVGGPLRIDRLHLGGGTPNMLPPETLTRLVQGLGARFDTSRLMEFAAELDPEVLTPEWIASAGALGLTRASLGVQDLSPQVQAAVNRPETFDTIATAAEGLRAAGVFSLNLDRMDGLPSQGTAEVEATLRQVLTLRPERLALFGYAHVPWMKPHQRLIDVDALPGAEARFTMSRAAEALLGAAGYQTIGLDHFALPHDDLAAAARAGRLHRNFQGYTADEAEALIGLGASSISRTRDLYVQNAPAERDWRAAVAGGGFRPYGACG
ncbi:MAG: oxygen-independent coproporphyrinogen III oxidase [Brevundimonas sp.]